MITITKYTNETDIEFIECGCIQTFYKSIKSEIESGWKLFDETAAVTNDITSDYERLLNAKNIVMLKPAYGPTIAAVGVFLAEWGTAISAAIAAAGTIYSLTLDTSIAGTTARTQSSATNSLGSRNNTEAIGSRMPDIYGFVGKHVPPLAQLPHFRYEDDTEIEHFAVFVSVGSGLIDNLHDGETSFSNLSQSKANFWKGGGNPNNGIAPYLTEGGLINRPLINVRKSGELQSGELLPPNDLGEYTVNWFITGVGSVGTMRAESDDTEFDMNDYFSTGDVLTLTDVSFLSRADTLTLYTSSGSDDFTIGDVTDLSAEAYIITGVSTYAITITLNGSAGDPIYDAWNLASDSPLPEIIHRVQNPVDGYDRYTEDYAVNEDTYYFDVTMLEPATVTENYYVFVPSVAEALSGIIGPYQVPSEVTSISFNVVANSGYFKLKSNNDVRLLHDFTCIVDETDEDGIPTGNGIVYPFTFGSNSSSITADTGKTIDIAMNDYTYQQVSFRRISNRDQSDNISNSDKAILRDLYFYTELSEVPDWGDLTIGQIAIYSNSATQGIKERQINLDFTRNIQRYSNGLFEPTSEIADVITAICLDERNGRLSLDDIDADLFQEVQAQLISYFGGDEMIKVGYCLDSTKIRFQEIYTMFWSAVVCEAYAQGATYKVYPDILRGDSSKQFTHRNKITGTDSSESLYDRDYDSVEVTYRSGETGDFETIERFVNGYDGTNPVQIELSAAISEKQAQVRADRELNILLHQTKTFAFESDGIALLTVPGERVDVVDDSRIVRRENNSGTYEVYQGHVVNQSGLEIQLSEPVYFADNDLHTIRFTTSKGDLLESIPCVAGSTAFHVILSQAPSESIYLGYRRERTNFTFSADRLRSGLAVLVRALTAGNSNGIRTRKITGINYSELYYQNDKD